MTKKERGEERERETVALCEMHTHVYVLFCCIASCISIHVDSDQITDKTVNHLIY